MANPHPVFTGSHPRALRGSTWRKARVVAAIGVAALAGTLTGGCAWWTGAGEQEVIQRGCPNAGILPDAQVLTEYRPGGGRDIIDETYRWELLDVASRCSYDGPEIEVDYALSLVVNAGPAATETRVNAPFFVAITRNGDTIIDKKLHQAVVTFEPGQRSVVYTRTFTDLTWEIGEDDGLFYDVVLGFQLTPAQVAENRRRARF